LGLIDGSNATFTTEFSFVPETVETSINGLVLDRGVDFNTSGDQTIIYVSSPEVGDIILVNYVKGD
jgi:hypothetical protein